eukprot:530341-Rhodomonas_salina.1
MRRAMRVLRRCDACRSSGLRRSTTERAPSGSCLLRARESPRVRRALRDRSARECAVQSASRSGREEQEEEASEPLNSVLAPLRWVW